MQEIRRFWQDESGGFECNLGKIEAGSNFQARSRKSKDGKDKADGLAADQVDEQTPKMKKRKDRDKDGKDKADGLAADQVNEQTPKIKIKIKIKFDWIRLTDWLLTR